MSALVLRTHEELLKQSIMLSAKDNCLFLSFLFCLKHSHVVPPLHWTWTMGVAILDSFSVL